MGIWAGIKHALNDTLGTSNFKPLNQIVTSAIENSVSLVPSDSEVYYSFPTNLQSWMGNVTGGTEKSLVTFTMSRGGSANLKYTICPSDASVLLDLIIYKNGATHKTISKSYTTSPSSVLEPITFSKGDVFEIKVKQSHSGTVRAYLHSLNAKILSCPAPTDVTVKV